MQMGKNCVAVCIEPTRFVVDGKKKIWATALRFALPGGKVTRNGTDPSSHAPGWQERPR